MAKHKPGRYVLKRMYLKRKSKNIYLVGVPYSNQLRAVFTNDISKAQSASYATIFFVRVDISLLLKIKFNIVQVIDIDYVVLDKKN